ncbi:velvet factor-domain-containing protein [Mycena floridula]|nr:velvet factor-domain-containing protein [Mycena floridula]
MRVLEIRQYEGFDSPTISPPLSHPTPVNLAHQNGVGDRSLGVPLSFVEGQFTGKTVRAELQEIQKADLARKFAKIDRRPLDPPPVVGMRLFHVAFPSGNERENEQEFSDDEYDDVELLGLICTVELVADFESPSSSTTSTSPTVHGNQLESCFRAQQVSPTIGNSTQPGCCQDESEVLTLHLVGDKFVQPVCLDWQGRKTLMFAFPNLAVRLMGEFSLRYRVFDLFSRAWGSTDISVQAECYGQPFFVYSTKDFPGLAASTELTKHLARYNPAIKARESERKRKRQFHGGWPVEHVQFQ